MENNLVTIVAGRDPVYHGSGKPGMKQFQMAEEYTVGCGVYFTDENSAEGYAKGRARQIKGVPVVYSAYVTGIKFIDLRDKQTLDVIMDGFAKILREKLQTASIPTPDSWILQNCYIKAVEIIQNREYSPGSIKKVTFSLGKVFSGYLQSLGYDGLMANEGGEGDYVKNHNSWLVFDPSRIQVISERRLGDEKTSVG